MRTFFIATLLFLLLGVYPAFAQDQRLILIYNYADNEPELLFYNLDTRITTSLTPIGYVASFPSLSFQKDAIVFCHRIDGDVDVFILNLATMQMSRLVDTPLGESHPTWSLDGTKIAFETEIILPDATVRRDIMVVNRDGSNLTNITQNTLGGVSPDWNNDGTKIAYVRDDSIFTIDIATRTETKIIDGHGPANVQWSPNNSKLLFFDADGYLSYVSLTENGIHPIIRLGDVRDYEWVDNDTIVYEIVMDGVYLMNIDGTHQERLLMGVDLYSYYIFQNSGAYFLNPPVPLPTATPTFTPTPTNTATNTPTAP